MPYSKVKLISFDLDNTLYDNRPVIAQAEKQSTRYLTSAFKAQNRQFDFSDFSAIRQELLEQADKGSLYDDLTRLRKDVLRQVCASLDNADIVIEQALAIFLNHRSQVQIPQPIHRMLETLAKNYKVVSVTNGNCKAELLSCSSVFSQNYSPVLGFRAKPHPEMLHQVKQDFSLSTEQILHIGDSETSDGEAARAAGCHFHYMSPFAEQKEDYSAVSELMQKLGLS
jgi:putative hydrolase of the HAD superfamily